METDLVIQFKDAFSRRTCTEHTTWMQIASMLLACPPPVFLYMLSSHNYNICYSYLYKKMFKQVLFLQERLTKNTKSMEK